MSLNDFAAAHVGQVLSLGKCLIGEKSDEIKIAVRNTSRKKREYVIQLDPGFSNPNLKPTFHFSLDETPSAIITQAQEKKLDEELEKLEHKLRIATTKKKTDKITKLNSKISRVRALLSGEQVPNEKKSAADRVEAKSALDDVRNMDVYDSCNSESEMSESESVPRSRRRPKLLAKSLSLSDTRGHANQLHFSLDAEATCRIVAYAVFTSLNIGNEAQHHLAAGRMAGFTSQKARKRQLRRDSTPIIGVGKFLLFEQQNKDVMKELQYSAEIFLRTAAGEAAFSRAVGRRVLPQLAGSSTPSRDNFSRGEYDGASHGGNGVSGYTSELSSSGQHLLAKSGSGRGLTISIPESERALESGKVLVRVEPNQFAISHSSTLLIPLEESPSDTYGWSVTLSHQSPVPKKTSEIEVFWRPSEALRSLLGIQCDIVPAESLISGDNASKLGLEGEAKTNSLPLKVRLTGDRALTLHFKWCFAAETGFAPSSSLAACINRTVLGNISKAVEQNAGKLEFLYYGNASPSSASVGSSRPLASVDVAVVKAVQRSLCLDSERIDLGEQQQNAEVQGEFIIRNRSHQPVKFLLLATGPREQAGGSGSSAASSASSGGDITFEKPNGSIAANSHVVARFTYKGTTPGQHSEQIQLRNLNDRLDTSILTVAVRVTRPVYVRIPELDLHATGQLEILDLGPCYVTPEMQDTTVESPNISLKFSKVHKLTLHSQVDESLVVCASSNLKTQCYVFEDGRLNREATHVVLKGKQTIDLFAAFRPRLSGDAFKTGSTRDLVGGIRVQLFRLPSEMPSSSVEEEKSEMVAEFTIKFVGVAGASLARVIPSNINFGVERNLGGLQTAQAHEGRFELINISKALPLRYRLFVTTDADSYSDDDDSLKVVLEHEQGEVPPGETKAVQFRLTAFKSGLFRRRILVENVHYPGKISFIDVVLFVDNGALKCEVFGSKKEISGAGPSDHGAAFDFGVINVIKLEEELSDSSSVPGGEVESLARKYRIFEKQLDEPTSLVGGSSSSLSRKPLTKERFLILTNTTDSEMVLRPVSTLQLDFTWCSCGNIPPLQHKCRNRTGLLTARTASVDGVRRMSVLVTDAAPSRSQATAMYFGEVHRIAAHTSGVLLIRFAPISLTTQLPCDTIESGKLCPFSGVVAIQRFNSAKSDPETTSNLFDAASTLKVINVSGEFGESCIQVVDKHISLGKIGYAIGWKSSSFEVSVKNVSDIEVCFAIAKLPPSFRIRNVQGATQTNIVGDLSLTPASDHEIPSLRKLALQAEHKTTEATNGSCNAWKLEASATCVMEMEFVRTSEVRKS